jgi:uncharacterized membrane protein
MSLFQIINRLVYSLIISEKFVTLIRVICKYSIMSEDKKSTVEVIKVNLLYLAFLIILLFIFGAIFVSISTAYNPTLSTSLYYNNSSGDTTASVSFPTKDIVSWSLYCEDTKERVRRDVDVSHSSLTPANPFPDSEIKISCPSESRIFVNYTTERGNKRAVKIVEVP